MPHSEPILAGCRILITRPADRAATLARRLEALGGQVFLRPTIRIAAPDDPSAARRAAREVKRYDWVVFTSVTGVRRFFELYDAEEGSPSTFPAVAAIGKATAAAVESHGITARLLPGTSRSEAFAEALSGRVGPETRMLLVRPEQARAVLPDAMREVGVAVDSVAFYRTVAAARAPEIAGEVCRGAFDVAVFTSPSTLRCLLHAGKACGAPVVEALRRTANVAIGEVTAESLRREGLPVARVAEEPGDEGLLDAILRARRS